MNHDMHIEHLPIDDLRPDPANPRQISEAELEALTRSMREFGFIDPVIARREGRTVIGGHQRLLAARRLGMKTVPVVLVDLSVGQARVLNLALNKISGSWDQELLARMVADLQPVEGIDLTLSGFGEDELAKLVRSLEARDRRDRAERFDLAEALEEMGRAPARTQPGDLWLLGEHRLLCADSTQQEDVARLMDGRQAAMAFTDSPYNVDYGHHGGQQRGSRKRSIANDAMPAEQWEAFCRTWAAQLVSNVDGALYVCMSTKEWPVVSRVLGEAGAHWSDTIIWAKDRFTLGRADYQRQYEPIWYGWRDGAKHHWCGDRDQGDIWQIPRPARSELHPTTKPLQLVERAIANSSRPGDVVLDLFMGSGSTLIASERTGRISYGAELDPHYCDIVVARWESFAGQKAERVDGESLSRAPAPTNAPTSRGRES